MEKFSRRKFLKNLLASCLTILTFPLFLKFKRGNEKLEPKEASYYKKLAG